MTNGNKNFYQRAGLVLQQAGKKLFQFVFRAQRQHRGSSNSRWSLASASFNNQSNLNIVASNKAIKHRPQKARAGLANARRLLRRYCAL